MTQDSELDLAPAHKQLAAQCFSAAWKLLDKPERSADDDDQLVMLAQASVWHWTQRPDCTPKNLSIGYWQLARVYAVLKRPAEALHYAVSIRHRGHDRRPDRAPPISR